VQLADSSHQPGILVTWSKQRSWVLSIRRKSGSAFRNLRI